jgi:hypothetical protein
MKRISVSILAVLVLALLVSAYSPLPQASRQPDQSVKAKKILVNEVPKEIEGIALKNGVFKLKQGYKFVNQTRNTVAVALKANGAITGTFMCGCFVAAGSGKTPSGDCEAVLRNDQNGVGTLTCQKKDTNPCNDTCLMSAKRTNQIFKLAIY